MKKTKSSKNEPTKAIVAKKTVKKKLITKSKRTQKRLIMKSYASFDLWLIDQSAKNQSLINHARKLVKSCKLGMEEVVKWSNGCWVKNNLPVVYIYSAPEGIQFGFFAGSMLKDIKGKLKGNGKFVRFFDIRSKADFDEPYLIKLTREASKIVYK